MSRKYAVFRQMLNRLHLALTNRWLYGSSGSQLCRFARFIYPVEVNIQCLFTHFIRKHMVREVLDEVLGDRIEDVERSDIKDFGDSVVSVSTSRELYTELICVRIDQDNANPQGAIQVLEARHRRS